VQTAKTINRCGHLLALKTSDFDAFIKKLEQAAIVYSDWPGTPNTISIRADGIKQIFFQDLDGYWMEVNSVGME
jgi:lactoylglutathione lyase